MKAFACKTRCARRFRSAGAVAMAVIATTLCSLFAVAPSGIASAAPSPDPPIEVAMSTDAYWYQPDGTVRLSITVDNREQQAQKGLSIRLKLHDAISERAGLDTVIDGKPGTSAILTRTIEKERSFEPGSSVVRYDLLLAEQSLENGVYPISIDVLKSGSSIATDTDVLVLVGLLKQENVPLRLSMIFDVAEPAHIGPDGKFRDNTLARECSSSEISPGWLAAIVAAAERWQDIRLTFAMSPMLLAEISDMTDGYVVQGKKEEHLGSTSQGATDAAKTLEGYRRLARESRIQFLSTPYASPDIENLWQLKWYDDARDQITRGHGMLEEFLDASVPGEFFFPPGLNMDSRVIRALQGEIGNLFVLGPQLLERNSDGRKLARGLTLAQPVEIRGAKDHQNTALFADARMEGLICRIGGGKDPQEIAQLILADLTNLYLERPEKLRACAMIWPSNWRPDSKVLNEVLKSLSGAPWLQSATLANSLYEVPPVQNMVLEIPDPESSTNAYFDKVGAARQKYVEFSGLVFPKNPLTDLYQRDIYISESDTWRQWNRNDTGLTYAEAVSVGVMNETAKIEIPGDGAITLSGKNARVPLTVVNSTGYRVKATFLFSSNGLTFPEGEKLDVTLEPKENLFEIPVSVQKTGRVRFTARLESNGLILGIADINVRAGRFSTFAIILVAALLGIIIGVWTYKRLSRRRQGKHVLVEEKGGPGRKSSAHANHAPVSPDSPELAVGGAPDRTKAGDDGGSQLEGA